MRLAPFHLRLIVVLAAACSGLPAGCGSSAPNAATNAQSASLVLDFTPNAVHAGIYSALARGYLQAAGVNLQVMAPPASTDGVKLLRSGRTDFAILDIHDLAIARQAGQDIVGIMAIVERPLAAVIASGQVRDPRQLAGRSVGVTGAPSDVAVLHSVVAGAGGRPRRVKTVTIGFNAVPALLAHRIAAATAFWTDEGVTLAHDRRGFHSFRVERYGAPAYPELVLCATRQSLRRDPGLARRVVRALVRGYEFTLSDPTQSAADLESRVQGLNPQQVKAQLSVELPVFRRTGDRVGTLGPATLTRWAQWEARFGIVRRPPDTAQMFDSAFLPAPGR